MERGEWHAGYRFGATQRGALPAPRCHTPRLLYLLLALVAVLVFPWLALAQEDDEPKPGRVVLVVAPALDARETLGFLATAEFHPLAEQCAVGLMNATVARPYALDTAYRTLLAGRPTPADGRPDGPTALDALVAVPKAFGMACLVSGPASPLLAAARRLGAPVHELRAMPGEPYAAAVHRALAGYPRRDLLLVDAAPSGPLPGPLRLFETVLSELDPERDLALLTAPAPSAGPGPWDHLSVTLAWSAGWEQRELNSATTRTPGLIASVDPAATALAWLGVAPPPALAGRPLAYGAPLDLSRLAGFARHAESNHALLVPVLFCWGVLSALIAAVGLWAVLRPTARRVAMARVGLAAAVAVPGAFLLVAALPIESAAENVGAILAATALLAGLALKMGGRRRSPVGWAMAFSAVLILFDLARGGPWLRLALLSNFPLTGVRFYGIGNEYAGLLTGMGVGIPLWIGSRSQGQKRPALAWLAAAVWWALCVILVGGPDWGANLGGMAAMAAAAATAAWIAAGRRLGWREAALGAAMLVLLMAALIGLDALRPAATQTHLGRLAHGVQRLGWGHLLVVAARKWRMNREFLTSGYFLLALALVAPLLGVWYHKANRASLQALRRSPLLQAAVAGGLVGGLVGFFVNDSGVVVWALASTTALVWWLDLLLDVRRGECVR